MTHVRAQLTELSPAADPRDVARRAAALVVPATRAVLARGDGPTSNGVELGSTVVPEARASPPPPLAAAQPSAAPPGLALDSTPDDATAVGPSAANATSAQGEEEGGAGGVESIESSSADDDGEGADGDAKTPQTTTGKRKPNATSTRASSRPKRATFTLDAATRQALASEWTELGGSIMDAESAAFVSAEMRKIRVALAARDAGRATR